MHIESMAMKSHRRVVRQTGLMLGATVLLMLAHIAADIALGHGRVSTLFVLLYGVPAGVVGTLAYQAFGRHDLVAAAAAAFGFAGHGLLIVITSVILLSGLQFPAEFALYGAEPRFLGGSASLVELVMDKAGKAAFVFLGLGLTSTSLAFAKSEDPPLWIVSGGVVVGISCTSASLLALADVVVSEASEVIMGVSGFASLVMMGVLSHAMVFGQVGRKS